MTPSRLRSTRRPGATQCVRRALLLLALLLVAAGGTAARTADGGAAASPPHVGAIRGQVFDGKSGEPLEGVTVIVEWPEPADRTEARQEVAVTGADGAFHFARIPAGTYDLRFNKSGYQASTMTSFTVRPGTVNRADFPLPPRAPDTAEEVLQLDEFVVEASTVEEAMPALGIRMESDQLLNILSAEDLSKYAAGDVAEALERVAGVTVAEGQFAVIRGLEDRYNTTLYNSAVVPSPDPDRQSVQLDLFPSDIVSSLIVSKTFSPEMPSNTSGGAVNIVTHRYPEELELELKGGAGFNSNAADEFLQYQDGSPIGDPTDIEDTIESDVGAVLGGRHELFERELRFEGVFAREIDYETKEGFQEGLEPAFPVVDRLPPPPTVVESADLSLGRLSLSDGRFDLTESTWERQLSYYGSLGLDLDPEGRHRIDASVFYTERKDETVQLRENGYLPGFDYSELAERGVNGSITDSDFNDDATRSAFIARALRDRALADIDEGPVWFSSFSQSRSFERDRDLVIYQANGEHRFEALPGLELTWAANRADTSQEDVSNGSRYFYEPCGLTTSSPPCPPGDSPTEVPDEFPVTPGALGPGAFASTSDITFSQNQIDETQDFGRLDAEYETDLSDWLRMTFKGGVWLERADRDVDSAFLEGAVRADGNTEFSILGGETPQSLGNIIFDQLSRTDGMLSGIRDTTNESSREIDAWSFSSKATLWEKLDVVGGFRRESIFIESINDAFTGETSPFGGPQVFPSRYLFFDRLDNPALGEPAAPPDLTFNDELLGIDVPVDPETGFVDVNDRGSIQSLVNGEIDEDRTLPMASLAYRPLEGLTLRGAWSETVARPSFREMGYYVSVEPGTDDLIVGNPQLGLSDVESWDLRAEYVWGEYGDLVAVSGFYKTIEDPIEQITVRNPIEADFDSSTALFRTWFNNQNEATLWGVELEGRKNFGFLGPELLHYLSLGGNFTYIDAEVGRSEAELARSRAFFGTAPGDEEKFSELEDDRRLFNQPEWIVNADLTLDHPGWGTKATLAFFAISDVLDSAGSANLGPSQEVVSLTLDRYIDSYYELRFTFSQTWSPEAFPGEFTLSGSGKNLTDSSRGIIYDPEQTSGEIDERSYKIGRDWSLSLSYTVSF